MKYVRFGSTGLTVSRLCLGTMTWGTQNTEAEGHAQMDMALEAGVTFWDTAEMYSSPPNPETQGNTVVDNARMFALGNIAMADAGVAIWDYKYKYDFWRPISMAGPISGFMGC